MLALVMNLVFGANHEPVATLPNALLLVFEGVLAGELGNLLLTPYFAVFYGLGWHC